jgi:hypothetical protein
MAASHATVFGGNTWITTMPTDALVGMADAQAWNFDGTASEVILKTPPNSFVHGIAPASILLTSTAAAVPGTLATGGETPDNALAVKLQTSTPGKRGRGRVYTPAFSEESSDDSGLVTTGIQGFVNAWIVGAAAAVEATLPAPTFWGVFSRTATAPSTTQPVQPGEVFSAAVDRRIRNQRRRQLRAPVR